MLRHAALRARARRNSGQGVTTSSAIRLVGNLGMTNDVQEFAADDEQDDCTGNTEQSSPDVDQPAPDADRAVAHIGVDYFTVRRGVDEFDRHVGIDLLRRFDFDAFIRCQTGRCESG